MRKKDMNFRSLDSLNPIKNVLNEATAALGDPLRNIRNSSIPEVLAGVLGAGVGGIGSFAALYGLGLVGLSAAGITSGLAAAGAVIGGGMVAGIFVLAAPIAVLTGAGVGIASAVKNKQLKQEKERLLKEALSKHDAIIRELKKEQKENDKNGERLDYLKALIILLKQAIKDLNADMGMITNLVTISDE